LDNAQEATLPKIEVEGDPLRNGDVITVQIFKIYAGEYFVSERRHQNVTRLTEQLSSIEDNQVLSGTVESYDRFNYIVTMPNQLKGKVYIKNMDTAFIKDPELYIGKTFDFKILKKFENDHNIQFELDRRAFLVSEAQSKSKDLAAGKLLTIDDYQFNKGGLSFTYKGIRGFVPMRELSNRYYASMEDAAADFSGPVAIKITEMKIKNNFPEIIGSIRQTLPDP